MKEVLNLNEYQYKYEKGKNNLNIFSEYREINITGDSTLDILYVLDHCNKELSIDEIYIDSNFTEDYFKEILDFLVEKRIVSLHKKEKSEIYKYLSSMNISIENIDKEMAILKSKKLGIYGDSQFTSLINTELSSLFETEIIEDYKNIKEKDLYILLYSYENIEKFIEFNKIAHEKNLKFLRVVMNKGSLRLGPISIPEQTVCYSCFISRVVSNKQYPDIYIKYHSKEDSRMNIEDYQKDILISSVISVKKQLVRYFSQYLSSEIMDKEIIYDFEHDEINYNKILMVPNCDYCEKKSFKN